MIKKILAKDQIDYLEEMMNIGAGNSATALEQLLQNKFEMHMPKIYVVPPQKIFSLIGDPMELISCVKMNMIGDIRGEMFFIVSEAMQSYITQLAEQSAQIEKMDGAGPDTSVIEEIGNIMAGVYLTAIHDFCKLNIYHTIPLTAHDMAQSVLDETIARMGADSQVLFVILNMFTSTLEKELAVKTFLLMIPSADSEKILLDSIQEAMKVCGR